MRLQSYFNLSVLHYDKLKKPYAILNIYNFCGFYTYLNVSVTNNRENSGDNADRNRPIWVEHHVCRCPHSYAPGKGGVLDVHLQDQLTLNKGDW